MRKAPRAPIGRDPDLFCGRASQRDGSGIGGQGEGLIVVASRDVQLAPRDGCPAAFQKFQQMAVAFIDAADVIIFSGLGMGKQQQAPPSAAGRTFQFAEVAVRAGAPAAQLGQQLGFEVGRDGVFQALGFIVHFVPFHAEDFRQHALDQVMAQE